MLPVRFVELMKTGKFKKKFSVLTLEVKHVLESEIKLDVPKAKSILQMIMKKADVRHCRLEKSMFAQKSQSGPNKDRDYISATDPAGVVSVE